MRNRKAFLIGVLAFAIAVLAGRWGKALFTTSEFVHFSVNFPTAGGQDTMPLEELGGPWLRHEDASWNEYPPGGLLVWGLEGRVTVDLGQQGWIKELVQPHSLLLSTHWLRNVGTRPYRVGLELQMCGYEVRWITFERFWDENERAFTRTLDSGKMGNMDWEISIPPERFDQAVICKGGLSVLDADNGALLTFLPIHLINTSS